MKILLITDNHSPHAGGAEKHFFTLKELLKNQPDTRVYSLGFGTTATKGEDFRVFKESHSKALRQFWRMFVNPVIYWQLRRAIKQVNPNVIHLHNIKKYTPALLKAVRGYPVLQTVHDFSPICPTQWNVHKDLQPCKTGFSVRCFWQHRRDYSLISYLALVFSFLRMRRLLKKSVRQFIAPSFFLAEYLKINYLQNTTVIFPFISHETTTITEPEPFHFLYLGQLEKQKGVDVLLREFYLAAQENSQITLTIAGSGSQEAILKEKTRQWNLQTKINFVGWQKNPAELYEKCCAVIFPSIGLESFGLVMTEAMGHARPVIASNRGPATWLIKPQETGLLFDPLVEGDLAAQILKLANIDGSLAKELGHNAYHQMKLFPSNADSLAHYLECVNSFILPSAPSTLPYSSSNRTISSSPR